MSDDVFAFGTWVRLRRQSLVLTREELAGRVGCAEVTIRKIEADERKPSPQIAQLLAQQLGLPIEQHDLFVRVARGILAVEHLPAPILGAPVQTAADTATLVPLLQHMVVPALPSGTVTFLFTDIEGSTRRWEEQPDAMRVALAHHNAILYAAIETHDGHVFKTIGDAFCAAFASAPDALAAAVAGQRTLSNEGWGEIRPIRVRMALHTGTAEPQDGDYLGQPLNRAARLLAAGHGGQILLSLAAHELVRDGLPAGTSLSSLGTHRLKDLARPEPIYQASLLDLPADFPPLKSLDARSTNLPASVNELIGRTREAAEVITLLQGNARLVTLTGPGGTGKTRLSLQIGAELLEQYADGVWFVDLSPVSDPEQVATTIAQVLSIPESPDRPIRDGVLSWLRERQALLLLDNCEQIIAGVASLVADMLRGAAKLQILATSRIPLRIAAEHEYAVEPLGLPDLTTLPSLEQLSQYDAVALFVTRARAVRADFSITNAPAVAEICVRLDGLPLAIELAAARIRLFSPEQLLSRLISARLQTLTGGTRDLPARQQTIRTAIDWSYRLLLPTQQRLLACLGVFVGGWTLEAAEAVCSDPESDVLEGLEALLEQNLVKLGDTGIEPRYTMLETIREFALERLEQLGETLQVQQRHAAYFVAFAEEAEPHLRSGEQLEWLALLDSEYSNLRAALLWAFDNLRHIELGARAMNALAYYWNVRSMFLEYGYWTSRSEPIILAQYNHWQDSPETHDNQQLRIIGYALFAIGDYYDTMHQYDRRDSIMQAAIVLAEHIGESRLIVQSLILVSPTESPRALLLARKAGDSWLVAAALQHSARWTMWDDSTQSMQFIEESLDVARTIGDRFLLQGVLFQAAHIIRKTSNNHAMTHAYLQEALELSQAISSLLGEALARFGFAEAAEFEGAYNIARTYYQQVIALEQQIGKPEGVANSTHALAMLAWDQGDYDSAYSLLTHAAELYDQAGAHQQLANSFIGMLRVRLMQSRLEESENYGNQALDIMRKYKIPHGVVDCLLRLGRIQLMCGNLERARALCEQAILEAEQISVPGIARAFDIEIQYLVGLIAFYTGEVNQAFERFQFVIETAQAVGYLANECAEFQCYAALSMIANASWDGACTHYTHALAAYHRIGAQHGIIHVTEGLATMSALHFKHKRHAAPRLWGAAEALREQIGAPMWPVDRPAYEQRIAEARAQVDSAEWEAAWAAGRVLTWEQAANEALAWLDTGG